MGLGPRCFRHSYEVFLTRYPKTILVMCFLLYPDYTE